MRTRITLSCTECKQRNIETKKYCRFCKRHTTHKETK